MGRCELQSTRRNSAHPRHRRVGGRGDRCLWVDESAGRVRKLLDESQIAENTLVIFTSDNGPKYSKPEISAGHDGSGPYRGFKTDAWDGGSRVPFIVRWPARMNPNQVNDHLLCLTDVLPTAASITGSALPEWAAEDGVDQSAQFLDPKAAPARHSMITQSYTGILSIRRDNWKLIFDTLGSGGFFKYSAEVEPMGTIASWRMDLSQSGQLYDLSSDPYEEKNLYADQPAMVKKLSTEMQHAINSERSHPKIIRNN
ncbi:MAG: arylsulfatase A [Verrucomicrobiales bacterium]|jgi:arylsulfatase A